MSSLTDIVVSVARATWREHARHRAAQLFGVFILVLLASITAGGNLAATERERLVVDAGLAGIQAITLLGVLFVSVTLLLEEIDSRTIYLILAKPAPRWTYLLGRYAGTAVALTVGVLGMALFHVACLACLGWRPNSFYLLSIAACLLKSLLVSALALALSLATTSGPSAMAFTAFLWVLGNFSEEVRQLGERSAQPLVSGACWLVSRVAPDFALLSVHGPAARPLGWLSAAAGYSIVYGAATLGVAAWLFEERDV